MRTPQILFPLLLLCLGCSGGDRPIGTSPVVESQDSRPTATPPSVAAWKTSEDGTLSLRLTAPETLLQPSEPIPVVAELRNNSDNPMDVLRPCGDWPNAVTAGIELLGPKGKVDYSGPTPTYVLGVDSFYRLQPNEIIEDRAELTVDDFAGSDAAGQYTIRYTYLSEGWQRIASRYGFKELWIGVIECDPVTILKSETAVDRAERFKKNISIVFPKDEYTFRLSEVAKGVKFDYEIVVEQDFHVVFPSPQDAGSAQGPGSSELYPFESVFGNGQSYSLADIGLAPPRQPESRTIEKGTYLLSFEWDGRNWGGPSDTDNPKGRPFPPGTYTIRVRLIGDVVTPNGNKPYEIAKTAKVILKP